MPDKMLSTFEQREGGQLDWNGFTALTTISARAGEVNWNSGETGHAIETQVPLFDLNLEADDEVQVLFQTSDEQGNSDLSDLFLSNRGESVAWRGGAPEPAQPPTPVASNSSGITIDGLFQDWSDVPRILDDPDDVEDPDVDLLETAITSDTDSQVEQTYFYLKVDGEMLHGSVIPTTSARSRPGAGGDSIGPPIPQVAKDQVPLPVVTGEDTIRLFIDVDSNASSGYQLMGEEAEISLGVERMVELKGINGHITQRTVHEWQGQEQSEWKWSKGTLVEAAASGSEVEVAVPESSLGGGGPLDTMTVSSKTSFRYLIHVTSWDGHEDYAGDLTELEENDDVDQQPDTGGSSSGSGSRSSVSWPDTWTIIHSDADDGLSSDVELLGLSYASDSDHWFFRLTTESDVDIGDSTFGVFIDDVSSSDGTNVYDAAIAKYEATNDVTTDALLYHWDAVGDDWDRDTIQGSDHLRVNEGSHHGVDLAFDKDDLDFTLDIASDRVRAASIDSSHGDADEALETGQEWEGRNDPDYVYNDDVSGPTTIPEFSSLVVPVIVVMAIIGLGQWRRKESWKGY